MWDTAARGDKGQSVSLNKSEEKLFWDDLYYFGMRQQKAAYHFVVVVNLVHYQGTGIDFRQQYWHYVHQEAPTCFYYLKCTVPTSD